MKGSNDHSVAVVIPTVGRPTLAAAVASAISQSPAPDEVVVVVDGADLSVVPDGVSSTPRVRVLSTGGGRGPSGARMTGVGACTSTLVAFLDDDDRWLPGKLAAQLDTHRAWSERVVFPIVSCRAHVVDEQGAVKEVAPAGPFEPGVTSLPDFMFDRKRLIADGFVMGSSTLLAPRELLVQEPWNEGLRLHEDWEWLLRVSRRSDALVIMRDEALITYTTQAPANAASRPRGGWRNSAAFAEGSGLTARAKGDFLLCVSAGIAIAHGERADAIKLAVRAIRTARPGLVAWLVFGIQVLVPQRALSRVAACLRAVRRSRTRGGPEGA